ncbi:MAG: hypothetical protein HGA87_00460 [Desulfobulbaceae bacterium]|nr:hypothetical protein [Desulfobulbaceae bacterium]
MQILAWIKSRDWTATLLLFAALGLVYAFWQDTRRTQRDTAQLINALQDTVRVSVDKYGDKVSQISTIRTEKPQVFLNIKSNDAELKRLQEEVAKYKALIGQNGSVTNFLTDTRITAALDKSVSPEGVTTYSSGDEWYNVNHEINATGASVAKIEIKNEYTVAIGEEHGQGVVKIKNRNPYSTESEIRTYTPLPEIHKRWGVGPYVGVDAARGLSAGAAVSWHLITW